MFGAIGKKVSVEIQDKTLEFKQISINDEIWMQDNVDIAKIFGEEIDLVSLTRLMYRLLVDKSEFPRKVVKTFNEEGAEVEETIGGLYAFRELFHGQLGLKKLLEAF